jgi:hypothetical protein
MNLSEFTANYTQLSDDELLCLWADQGSLVPEAAMALENELQRRGLKKQNATRIKKRLDALAAREAKGPLLNQVAVAKYERNMRHFVGCKEPEFPSPYGSRDIRTMFASFRHRYRVWKAFRDHTGHWPVFSIWFYFLSWSALFAFTAYALVWVMGHNWGSSWSTFAVVGSFLALLSVRQVGARMMRKLDWKRYGAQRS